MDEVLAVDVFDSTDLKKFINSDGATALFSTTYKVTVEQCTCTLSYTSHRTFHYKTRSLKTTSSQCDGFYMQYKDEMSRIRVGTLNRDGILRRLKIVTGSIHAWQLLTEERKLPWFP